MPKTTIHPSTWDVEQVRGGWRVRHPKTGQVFQVLLKLVNRKRGIGPCSCGSRSSDNPATYCVHQRAADQLLDRQWLAGLPRRLPIQHPERLTPEFQQNQQQLLSALRRQTRAGHLDCPHCHRPIIAHDLEPDRHPLPRPQQTAFPFPEPVEKGGAS